MKPILGAIALCVAAGAAGSYPPYVKKTLYANVDVRGHRAPKLGIQDWVSGGAPSLKGKTVLVDMWATWCPSCRDLIPHLNRWSKKFKGQLVVIGISDESTATVKAFEKTHPMEYHVASDPKSHLAGALQVQAIPHVIVVSPDGIVRWQGYTEDSADPLTDAKLASIIRQGARNSVASR